MLKLQQILFYRELGLPLEDIKQIMGRGDYYVLEALESHKKALGQKLDRLNRLIRTVDDTILHLKGQKEMSRKQFFEAFSEEQQEEYSYQTEQMYDPEIVRASNRKWKAYSTNEKQRILNEGNQIYTNMVAAIPKGVGSPEAQAIVERWRVHMDYFWTPNLDQLLGLANGYNDDPHFRVNFDQIHPDLAGFMREAARVYVAQKKGE